MPGIEHTESAFLSAVQSLPIPSSALIALIAVLFIGAMVLRGQRQASSVTDAPPARQTAPQTTPEPVPQTRPAPARPMTSTPAHPYTDRGATMSSTAESHRSPASPRTSVSARFRSATSASLRSGFGSGLHLHWGRTLVALVGVLALLTAVVTGLLAPLTALGAAVPLIAAGIFVLCLVALRTMAVLRRRSRRRQRVQSAIDEAMNPLASTQWQDPGQTGLFDALSADDRGAGGPNSLQQIDEDGLPVGLERTFEADVQASGPLMGEAAEPVGPWQPRSVPRPKYLDLDKAQRVEPEVLEVQTPAPRSDVKLTQRRFIETPHPATQEPAAEQEPATQQEPAAQQTPEDQDLAVEQIKAPKHDSMDLDEVLRRRRA